MALSPHIADIMLQVMVHQTDPAFHDDFRAVLHIGVDPGLEHADERVIVIID